MSPAFENAIHIVGALDPVQAIPESVVQEVLATDERPLAYGLEFTGRPATKIHSSGDYVVKLRSEFRFSPADARRWIERMIEKERHYGVHHPAKTWFLILVHGQAQAVIANITPKMTPLHLLAGTDAHAPLLPQLRKLFAMYFRIAGGEGKHLDEGLSNFALTVGGELYYVDDDVYDWNDFVSLSNTLGVWIRQLDSLGPEDFVELGEFVRQSIIDNFRDPHWATVLAEQLRDLFTGTEDQRLKLQALIQALYPPRRSRIEPSFAAGGETPATQDAEEPPAPQARGGKIALLADVHANRPALEATLERLRSLGVSRGIVLGDVVGYGPHPKECIDLLRSTDFRVIKGNHDHAVAIGEAREGFSAMSRWVIDWTVARLDEPDRYWLGELPVYLRDDDWLAVHGAPQDKTFFNGYVYRLTYEENLDNIASRSIRVCFHGHTHIQGVYCRTGRQDQHCSDRRLSLDGIDYALVCPGAVGQPRGGRSGAEFAIYDPDLNEVEFFSIDYDLEETVRDLNRLQFPPQLATRLERGK